MNFYCLEHHGHGRSVGSGSLGLVESFDRLRDDAVQFCRHIINQKGKNRFGIVGHSLGGAISLYIGDILQHEFGESFVGVVALAPSVLGGAPGWATLSLLSGVSYILPWVAVGPEEHTELYDTGSGLNLNYSGKMRASTASMFVNDIYPRTGRLLALQPAERDELKMNFAFIIFSGDKDGVVPYKLMRVVVEGAATMEKALVKLKGKDHQPLIVEGWEEVASKMSSWFASRTQLQPVTSKLNTS